MYRLSIVVYLLLMCDFTDGHLVSIAKFTVGITRIHNYYRKMETAADMKVMVSMFFVGQQSLFKLCLIYTNLFWA